MSGNSITKYDSEEPTGPIVEKSIQRTSGTLGIRVATRGSSCLPALSCANR